jgi:hypothetical protein
MDTVIDNHEDNAQIDIQNERERFLSEIEIETFNMMRAAGKHSMYNREELENSEECACFSCLRIYSPSEILWWEDGQQTALCPICMVDGVIGSAAGLPMDEHFRRLLRYYYYSEEYEWPGAQYMPTCIFIDQDDPSLPTYENEELCDIFTEAFEKKKAGGKYKWKYK